MAIPPTASGATEGSRRSPKLDPPHEKRESDVGRAVHPWLAFGFEISEPTVSRYLRGLKGVPEESKASQWLALLDSHREVIAAFDFFTVPTPSFRTLYCFFAIEHDRRRILHFSATFHPTSDWIVQHLIGAAGLGSLNHRYS